MLGVVLWRDRDSNQAVIWCEDHGDLAYFDGPKDEFANEIEQLGTGDLVRFDVSEDRNKRYASNPKPVGLGSHAHLPEVLRAMGKTMPSNQSHAADRTLETRVRKRGNTISNVLQFNPVPKTMVGAE